MTISPGGRPADDSPFSTSKTSNWVARAGGLPKYIREVAHALVRHGHPESEAIATAVVSMKRWAAGEGHVTPKVQAAASAALAEWEAKKVKSHIGKSLTLSDAEFDELSKEFLGVDTSGMETIKKFNPNELRDLMGRWTKGGEAAPHVVPEKGQKHATGDSIPDVTFAGNRGGGGYVYQDVKHKGKTVSSVEFSNGGGLHVGWHPSGDQSRYYGTREMATRAALAQAGKKITGDTKTPAQVKSEIASHDRLNYLLLESALLQEIKEETNPEDRKYLKSDLARLRSMAGKKG